MALVRGIVRSFDYLMVLYMIVHIPVTLLFDIQSLFPRHYFPDWAVQMVDKHVKDHGDHLVGTNPLWFVSFVWGELLVQLPLFLPLAYGIWKEAPWVRLLAIIYGTNTATTVIPMLAEFLLGKKQPNYIAAAIYAPYFILPTLLAARMCLFWDPPSRTKKSKAKINKAA